jgi:hypothetical protein
MVWPYHRIVGLLCYHFETKEQEMVRWHIMKVLVWCSVTSMAITSAVGEKPISRTVRTFGIGGPYSYPTWPDSSEAFFQWLNEHIDWQLTGEEGYFDRYTRGQPIGKYLSPHSDYVGGSLHQRVLNIFQEHGVHADSGFAHWKENTYLCPSQVGEDARLVPGWNPVNDRDGDWVRDYEADFGWNNDLVKNFEVYRTRIVDTRKSWTPNQWEDGYLALWYGSGYGHDDSLVTFICTGNTQNTIYVDGSIPEKEYRWYIVDDFRAPDHQAVAMTDSIARICGYTWTREHFNVTHELVIQAVSTFADSFTNRIESGYEGPSALFIDDCFLHYPPEYCGVWYGGACLEGFTDSTWAIHFRSFLEAIDGAVEPAFTVGNTAEWRTNSYDTLMMVLDGNLLELWVQPWRERYLFNCRLEAVKRRLACGLTLFEHCTGWGTEIGFEREKVFALATYYLTASSRIYYLYDTGNAYGVNLGDTTKWWYGLMDLDLGAPLDTAYEFVDRGGAHVWRRNFSKGVVLVKPKPAYDSNYTDSTLVLLDEPMRRLDSSGKSVGPSIDLIWLRNAEAAVLLGEGLPVQDGKISDNGEEQGGEDM